MAWKSFANSQSQHRPLLWTCWSIQQKFESHWTRLNLTAEQRAYIIRDWLARVFTYDGDIEHVSAIWLFSRRAGIIYSFSCVFLPATLLRIAKELLDFAGFQITWPVFVILSSNFLNKLQEIDYDVGQSWIATFQPVKNFKGLLSGGRPSSRTLTVWVLRAAGTQLQMPPQVESVPQWNLIAREALETGLLRITAQSTHTDTERVEVDTETVDFNKWVADVVQNCRSKLTTSIVNGKSCYVCPACLKLCERRYFRVHWLAEHLNVQHVCAVCRSTYSTKSNLAKHPEKQHH